MILGSFLRTLDKPSPEPKVFGIGNLRTGSTSLGAALEILGYKHTHAHREVLLRQIRKRKLGRVYSWVDQYDSFEDWPWPLIYKELDAKYPNSRFILTVRSSAEVWLRSMVKYAQWIGPSQGREMFFGHSMPTGHEDSYVARYREHNQAVRNYFRDRPGKLLEVCWGDGQEWQKLCGFLGVPVPDVPFPKQNAGAHPIRK